MAAFRHFQQKLATTTTSTAETVEQEHSATVMVVPGNYKGNE
jgi:hypothetical protein